nr:MAG TPA: major capsid protein [Caudoviricetes sp.]
MPTDNRYTLAEYAQVAGLKGVQLEVVHTIEDTEPLFASAPIIKCNSGQVNKTQVITQYPVGQTRGYNMGVTAEKAASKVVQDDTCMIETYNEIDVEIVRQNGDSARWRANQDKAFVRGLAHSTAERIFNASKKRDPFEFDGLGTRYSKIDGEHVIDAAVEDTVYADLWLVNWGTNTVHLIYPEGGVAGLHQNFEQNVDARDPKNRLFKVDRTWYKWYMGLAVPDPAQVVRIANVPVNKALSGDYDLITALTLATEGLPGDVLPGCGIYMNQKLRSALRLQITAKPNVNLTFDTVAGKKVLNWDGIAVHKVPLTVLPTYTKKLA